MDPAEKPEDNSTLLKSSPSMIKCPQYFEVEICPSVFRLYTYLRLHPLVIENIRSEIEKEKDSKLHNKLALLDRRLYFRTAYHYSTIGCPALTLEVLRDLPQLKISTPALNNHRQVIFWVLYLYIIGTLIKRIFRVQCGMWSAVTPTYSPFYA